ncbi:MAG: chorismate-binding protein, partial [Caldivirga sp.]
EELLSSIKDRAEHVMLVDLARNDIGKVCVFGSVKVKELYAVEKYQSVQHLVSRVEGTLSRGNDIVDALVATFPAGTVTGAPKPRAMELIAKYEDSPRGPYAGALGIMHGGGGEFAIIIRSMFMRGSTVRIQAGAGIVYDSKPELELMETEHKLGSLKAAMGLGGGHG